MRLGTKSLLFGAHQFILHPLTVWMSWVLLYWDSPTWRECVCILIHDWGYWGCETMDGEDGSRHPYWAATHSAVWFKLPDGCPGEYYYWLCMCHSRHQSRRSGNPVSRLYHVDKFSFALLPWWLYVGLTRMTGEIWEYRAQTEIAGVTDKSDSHKEWFRKVRESMIKLALSETAVPYLHE